MSYIIRLDDAAPCMNHFKWNKVEKLLQKYNINPLIGIIPDVQDEELIIYKEDKNFWEKARKWESSGFAHIAMHGYQHVYQTNCVGINPVNNRSEFAGVCFEKQKQMLELGYAKLKEKGLNVDTFFAPSHTFDENTIKALKAVTPIRIISDTVANDVYIKDGITYVPQQSGRCRRLPFKITTFCYHPNEMLPADFVQLEKFLSNNAAEFVKFSSVLKKRPYSRLDEILNKLYFYRKKSRKKR